MNQHYYLVKNVLKIFKIWIKEEFKKSFGAEKLNDVEFLFFFADS
jgi:hypothetical protein